MPVAETRLSLVRTARHRLTFELRADEQVVGQLTWEGRRSGAATARVGERTWTLRPGSAATAVAAWDEAAGEQSASLGSAGISFAGVADPVARWDRNRSAGTAAELTGPDGRASVRMRRRSAPGVDVAIAGELAEPELLVLLAGYELLR